MDPNQRNIIVLAVLGVAVVGVVWYNFFRVPGVAGPDASAVAHTTPEAVQRAESVFRQVNFDIEELVQSIREVEFRYAEVRQARDPLAPLIGGSSYLRTGTGENEVPVAQDYDIIYEANRKIVTGVVWDPNNPMAVLSELGQPDEIVTVGYEFGGGIVVQDIQPNHILLVLKLENETMELVKELKEQ